MENQINSTQANAPRLIASLTEGFNTVANHIYLILFPLLLDMFLWLGPHLRVKNLLEPLIAEITSQMPELAAPEIIEVANWSKEIWDIILKHFNLISLVHVFPIGVPSLMSGLSPIETPYGAPALYEATSFFQVVMLWTAFSLLGIFLGSLYFESISHSTDNQETQFSIANTINNFWQIFLFTILFFVSLILFTFPVMIIVALLSLISAALGEIVLLFIFVVLLWFIMPLVFTPHGVFVENKPITTSISNSIKLVRNYLPGTGMFILTALLLYQGLNLLWETAPDSSWMSLVGILGHAFISTGLIASSFVYYRKGIAWMESKQRQTAVQL